MSVDLDELERALAAAKVHPPWMVNGHARGGWRIDDCDESRVGLGFLLTPSALAATPTDAALIVAAVNALPDLLRELRALRGVADAARARQDVEDGKRPDATTSHRTAVRAALAALDAGAGA